MNWTPSSVAPAEYSNMEYGGMEYFLQGQSQVALTLSSNSAVGGLKDEERKMTSSPLPMRTGGVPSPAVLNEQDNNSCGGLLEDDGGHEDLLVFGYECKIFRDNERAKWIDEQKHLIPWMGNPDLLIDRYDCRGALMDVSRYESGSSSKRQGAEEHDNNYSETWSEADEVGEKELDEERYRDLNEDEDYDEGAYDRATDFKRLQCAMDGMISESQKIHPNDTRQYATFQYDYNEQNHDVCMGPEPKRLHDDDAPFVKAVGLYIPEEIALPTTMKVHAIIEKTAKFIASQGNQMEIILKTKQAANPLFDFLTHGGSLNPYYKFLVHAIRNGIYRPVSEPVESDPKQAGTLSALSEYGGGEEDSEHTYLHPSLFRSTTATSYPSLSYPSGAATSRHSSYSMLVSKIKGTESPDPVGQQSVINSSLSSAANSDQTTLAYASYSSKPSQESVVSVARPQKQLPSTKDQLIIEKMASYVIKNGTNFEAIAKNKGDPRFAFLNSTHQYHWYYLNCKERFKAECNAVVASSDFVTYNSASASSSAATTVKSNASSMKKSAVVAELAELKRKGAGLLQGKKLLSKDKPGVAVAVPSATSTEDIFSHASLVSNKDKDKPVIRFATSLSLNTVTGSGTTGSNRTEAVDTLTLPSDSQGDENKEKQGEGVVKRRSSTVEEEQPKTEQEKESSASDKEDGELDEVDESKYDIFAFDENSGPTGGNASPLSENEDEKKRRCTERKRKAALFLQKLKLKAKDELTSEGSSVPSTEQTTQIPTTPPSRQVATGPSLGDLLNRRLQDGEVSSRSKTASEPFMDSGRAEIYVDDLNDEGKSSSSLSSREARSRSRSHVGSSYSSRSRKKRKRSRSYSSSPKCSSSASGSSDGSSDDYRNSYSRKKSSKRKHKKKKKKHEKSSRSSHKSSRR